MELRGWLSDRLAIRRSEQRFDAAFDLDVASDIATDVQAHEQCASRVAYSAEQEDLEAIRILEQAEVDGLSNADLPAIHRAIRLIRSSAKHDRAITEALA